MNSSFLLADFQKCFLVRGNDLKVPCQKGIWVIHSRKVLGRTTFGYGVHRLHSP